MYLGEAYAIAELNCKRVAALKNSLEKSAKCIKNSLEKSVNTFVLEYVSFAYYFYDIIKQMFIAVFLTLGSILLAVFLILVIVYSVFFANRHQKSNRTSRVIPSKMYQKMYTNRDNIKLLFLPNFLIFDKINMLDKIHYIEN